MRMRNSSKDRKQQKPSRHRLPLNSMSSSRKQKPLKHRLMQTDTQQKWKRPVSRQRVKQKLLPSVQKHLPRLKVWKRRQKPTRSTTALLWLK